MHYKILGKLKKRVNWVNCQRYAPPELFGEDCYRDLTYPKEDTYGPREWNEKERRWVSSNTFTKKIVKVPVITATLMPMDGGFKIKGTEIIVRFDKYDLVKILQDICIDHRRWVRGDGGIKLTFAYCFDNGVMCRLLTDEDEIVFDKEK